MKKRIVFILIILAILSCKKEVVVDYTIFSGKIDNTKGGELNISSINGYIKTINVNDSGVFSDTLFIPKDGLYNIRYQQLRFAPYLSKGGQIQFEVDAKNGPNSLKFSGNYTELNNYFAYKVKKEFDFMNKREANFNINEEAFETKINEFQKELENNLNTLKEMPKGLKAQELKAVNYSRLLKKVFYERMYGYLNKNRNFKASETFNNELAVLDLNNDADYLYSLDYQQIVKSTISKKASELYKIDSLSQKEAYTKAILEVKSEVIRNGELYKDIMLMLPMSINKENDFNDFYNNSSNESHKASAKELFDALKVLDPGQPSPKFENYENYAGGTTSLDELKGRYVYIDVWATWCGPCKYEIPFLKKLEETYHNKNIQFVSISVDKQKDKEKWKKMIFEQELKGIQLITDNDFNTSFINDYKIRGIPQFILLDPKGNIVKANAPRPSDEKLTALFNELNI